MLPLVAPKLVRAVMVSEMSEDAPHQIRVGHIQASPPGLYLYATIFNVSSIFARAALAGRRARSAAPAGRPAGAPRRERGSPGEVLPRHLLAGQRPGGPRAVGVSRIDAPPAAGAPPSAGCAARAGLGQQFYLKECIVEACS